MPRALRIEYEGAIYHVMNRGDRREDIFLGDEDRRLFLKTLEEACGKSRWQVHAYCLMSNHFHLVLEPQLKETAALLLAGNRRLLANALSGNVSK
jgi:REP element-mobilizing transposase RayT